MRIQRQATSSLVAFQVPADLQAVLPTIRSAFWDVGRRFLSHDPQEHSIAVGGIIDFLQQWNENREPDYQMDQSVVNAPTAVEFFEVLFLDCMEEERMVWEPVIRLHIGVSLVEFFNQAIATGMYWPSA